ncbi:DNA polymerase delta catalytic subunit [Quaeritorhiza haematococci]|nr:DNA polymerase delta catalytic subunit [Quaeritorhiza haematococci]
MSFDIEVFSHDGMFPDPTIRPNAIFQIGVTIRLRSAPGIPRKVLLHYGDCADIPGVEIQVLRSEKELLLAFQKLVTTVDPDFIYTYNGDKFDWNYLVERAQLLGCAGSFLRMGRFRGVECRILNEKLSSSAYGDNAYKRLEIPGRNNVDLLIYIQHGNEKFSDYKLDTVAESMLGMNKKDVSPRQIFAAYASKDPVKLSLVGDYCIQDTYLVQLLVDKLDVVTGLVEMSNITFIPLLWTLTKGQQIRAFSQITRVALQRGFRVPHIEPNDNESFKGAIVLEPEIGAFWTPVVVLDFASLYPTIMMAYNICYTTLVLDSAVAELPDVEYDVISWNEDSGEFQTFMFAQTEPGVVPQLQRDLYESRKRVKKLYKEATDPLQKRVLKGRELAIKVSMNSIYGFTSAYMLQMKSLAACVTAKGREMIETTKDFMENRFEGIAKRNEWVSQDSNLRLKVIGGDTDSVFVHFPKCSIEEAMTLGRHAEHLLTTTVFDRAPIRMEYEKVYQPYILQKKKNYIGKMYTDNPAKADKVDFKGIALKRRNYCNFMKEVYWNVVETVLERGLSSIPVVLDGLQTELTKLATNEVNIDDLVITAQLSAKYKAENAPHITLAKKLKERDPGSAPAPGERFPYIMIHNPKAKKAYERSEDPAYAREHRLPPDPLYYLNQQCRNPIMTFMTILGYREETRRVFEHVHRLCQHRLTGQRSIASYFSTAGPVSKKIKTKK